MKERINPKVACPRFPCQGDKSFCNHFYTGRRIQTFLVSLTRISTPKTGGEAKPPPWLLYARSGGWEPRERCRSLGHLETTKPAANSRAVPQSAALREAERGFGPIAPRTKVTHGSAASPSERRGTRPAERQGELQPARGPGEGKPGKNNLPRIPAPR